MKKRALELLERVDDRIALSGSIVVTALAMVALAGAVMQQTLGEAVDAALTKF